MPFFVYQIETRTNNHVVYSEPHEVSLAGLNGPIAHHVSNSLSLDQEELFEWHLNEGHLLTLLGLPPEVSRLVIDLKPSDSKGVSLYRLHDIWGISEHEWTPLMLRLGTLYVDEPSANIAGFKRRFEHDDSKSQDVYEFLYLNGGTKKGYWNWGRVGSVNGALLWPQSFKYFIARLPESMRSV